VTAAGTIIEERWDQLMEAARKCHAEMGQKTERVITFMKVDDYAAPIEDRSANLSNKLLDRDATNSATLESSW
jgi:uncharacterized protein YqgV (UPF0045/DUF77 family)